MGGWVEYPVAIGAHKKDKCPDLRVVIMQLEYSKTNMR